MQVNPESLYEIFQHSYAASAEERRRAESFLEAAERTPGFLVALLQIAVEPRAEASIRQAAAIQLKNQVRKWWAPTGENKDNGYREEDKAALRSRLLDGLAAAFEVRGVRTVLLETFRLCALHDFPESWPGLVDRVLAGLRSDDTVQTYAGLLTLRKLFKQLEMRPVHRRAELEALCERTLPTLRTLAPALAAAAAQPGPHCLEAFEMLKVILKCVYSSNHMAVNTHFQQEIGPWMQLLLSLANLAMPIAQLPADEQARETSPPAKFRKWIFHILFRFLHRHGNPRRAVDGMEDFAEAWSEHFALPVIEASLQEVLAARPGGGSWAPRRSLCLALLCLGEACARDALYEALRPALQQLLEGGIFPWVRFGPRDASTWQEDPEEFIRQMYNDFDAFQEPRTAAVELVERLLRYRKNDVLVPLLHFCRRHLDTHAQQPGDPELCANKDGALLLLGTMSEYILLLDPAQNEDKPKKKAKRKAKPQAASSAVSLEELLNNYVKPDMTGPVAFLRWRACWVYEKFGEAARLGPKGATGAACSECLRLTNDPELPVRVQASTCLQAFLQREGDPEVHEIVATNLAGLLDRLLRTLSEVQCEEVAMTLEVLVSQFPTEIVPFAAQLLGQLAAQFGQIAGEDEEEAGSAALGSLQTMVSVLQACATLKNPQDAAERQRRQQLFAALSDQLLPMLSRMLQPDGIDYLEEALEMLTYLTFFGPSPILASLWSLFPRLYQCVCGRSTPCLPLPPVLEGGWAPDFMMSLLPPLENFVSRGPPAAFLAGSWAEAGLTYPEMVFGIVSKVVAMTGVGSEKDCACGVQLCSAFFENVTSPGADAWLPRYFEELWRRLPTAETSTLKAAILHGLGSMLWYSPEAFLRCTEERHCTQAVFEVWMRLIDVVRKRSDRKVLVLGLLRLLELSGRQPLPAAVAAGLPHLVRQLEIQSKEIVRLRTKQGDRREESSEEESDEDDEEGTGARLEQVLRKLETAQDDGDEDVDGEDDDDDDLSDCSGALGSSPSFEERTSALDNVDELVLLHQALVQAPPAIKEQVGAWLGAETASQWLVMLEAECRRRLEKAATSSG